MPVRANGSFANPLDHGLPRSGGVVAEPGSIDLSAALHALADAGLPPDALVIAVQALLRAARPSASMAPPRLVEGA